MHLYKHFILALVFAGVSCGGSKNAADNEHVGYYWTDNSLSQDDNGVVSGTGTVLARITLARVSTDKYFQLKFKLPNPNSRLIFVSHSDTDLNNGVSLSFYREGALLCLALAEDKHCSLAYDGGDTQIGVDVHNRETPAHVLVWQGEAMSRPSKNNFAFNSEDILWDLKGRGVHFGAKLIDAQLQGIEVSEAVYAH